MTGKGKTCPSLTLPITSITCGAMRLNQCPCGKKHASNHVSYVYRMKIKSMSNFDKKLTFLQETQLGLKERKTQTQNKWRKSTNLWIV
jgi:hypothetical protein